MRFQPSYYASEVQPHNYSVIFSSTSRAAATAAHFRMRTFVYYRFQTGRVSFDTTVRQTLSTGYRRRGPRTIAPGLRPESNNGAAPVFQGAVHQVTSACRGNRHAFADLVNNHLLSVLRQGRVLFDNTVRETSATRCRRRGPRTTASVYFPALNNSDNTVVLARTLSAESIRLRCSRRQGIFNQLRQPP